MTVVGLDTNILCYMLDPAFPESRRASKILERLSPGFSVAVNPTVLQETYHTLVYAQRWVREEARLRLGLLLRHPSVLFHNQTKSVSILALKLAEKHLLGGRDSLMLANFISNKVTTIYTHDDELLQLGPLEWRYVKSNLVDPLGSAD